MQKIYKMLASLKISTSLVLVLAVFFFMLVAGGVLGVGSLYLNNQARASIVKNQLARASLMDSVNSYKDVQIAMGRALASYMVNSDMQNYAIAAVWGGANDNISALSEQSRKMLEDVHRQHAQVTESFNQFRSNIAGLPDPAGFYSQVDAAFSTLMLNGVDPLIALLEKSNINDYQSFLDGTTRNLEDDLISAVQQLAASQQKIITDTSVGEDSQYQRILLLVSSAIAAALLVCVLSYLFLKRVVLRPLRQAGDQFDRIANGDLTRRIDIGSRNEIGQLYAAMRRMQDGLARIVSEVRDGVDEILLGSEEIYRGNTDLSSRTEQQAAALQQTAASMEELDSAVRQNTENAAQADGLAKNASDVAVRGGHAVAAVVSTMNDISASANQMSEIVSVIDGIAFQTNILALNAAVEAARAGEQGRGFAVVAAEVRSLAQRSAQAAREIKQLIDDSLLKVEQGAVRADEAGEVMQTVVGAVQGVTTVVAEISLASQEQADGIGQVNVAIAQMDSVVQQNSALVEEAAAASGALQSQTSRLHDAVAFFRLNNYAAK